MMLSLVSPTQPLDFMPIVPWTLAYLVAVISWGVRVEIRLAQLNQMQRNVGDMQKRIDALAETVHSVHVTVTRVEGQNDGQKILSEQILESFRELRKMVVEDIHK